MAEMSRGEVNDLIAGFASKNAEYKQALLTDTKKVVGMQLGQELPDTLAIKVVEDTAEVMHMVLPSLPEVAWELC